MQAEINNNLTKMISRIAEIIEFNPNEKLTKHIKVSLIPPVILTLQLIESTLTSISDIQKLFAEMPDVNSDSKYLLSRFVSFIDWDEFFRESSNFKQRLELLQPNQQAGGVGVGVGY